MFAWQWNKLRMLYSYWRKAAQRSNSSSSNPLGELNVEDIYSWIIGCMDTIWPSLLSLLLAAFILRAQNSLRSVYCWCSTNGSSHILFQIFIGPLALWKVFWFSSAQLRLKPKEAFLFKTVIHCFVKRLLINGNVNFLGHFLEGGLILVASVRTGNWK